MHARLWLCPRVCQMCEDKQGGRRQGRKRSSTRNQKVEPGAAAAAGKGGVDVRVYAYMCVLTCDFICVRACVLSRDMAFLRVHLSVAQHECMRASENDTVSTATSCTDSLPPTGHRVHVHPCILTPRHLRSSIGVCHLARSPNAPPVHKYRASESESDRTRGKQICIEGVRESKSACVRILVRWRESRQASLKPRFLRCVCRFVNRIDTSKHSRV